MNSDFLQKNLVSITIALIGVISTYAIYGYRVGELEAKASELGGGGGNTSVNGANGASGGGGGATEGDY